MSAYIKLGFGGHMNVGRENTVTFDEHVLRFTSIQQMFNLCSVTGDGLITIEEMTDIATAVYELMGRNPEIPTDCLDPDQIKEKVEKIFLVSLQTVSIYLNTKQL